MSIIPTEQRFFADIAQILQTGRSQSYRAVNTAMLQTYWRLGQRIVKEEQHGLARAEYGQSILSKLSRYLGDQFGQGFSVANLRNFRQFYLTFPNFDEFITHCVANLSWTHVRLIMRLDNNAERNYYLQEASSQNWSSRLLERHIKSGYYRRVLAHQSPLAEKSPASIAAPFIKDPYVRMFDDLKRGVDDNPTLGIILCADKDETLVRYSVLSESQQLFASKYQTLLPTEAELAAMLEQEAAKCIRNAEDNATEGDA